MEAHINERGREMNEIVLLIPLILIELGLIVIALRDLIKRKRVKGGNKVLWAILILVFGYIGPIVYFVLGREED